MPLIKMVKNNAILQDEYWRKLAHKEYHDWGNYNNWVELSVTVVRKLKQLSQVEPQGGSETINLVKCHRDSETETIESS